MALNLRPAPTLERVAGWYNVKQFGATGNGTTDDTTAIQDAIDAAAKVGAGVWLPPGTYYINPSGSSGTALSHTSGSAITVVGSGRNTTKLVLGNAALDLLHLDVDYDSISDLTLDTQTNNGQAALSAQMNYGLFRRLKVLGGSNTYALYFPGPSGATQASPSYNTGNAVVDCIINDDYDGDGFSFSFQQTAFIGRILHTGSRLAIYVCDDVDVEGYSFTPGSQASTNGFYITAPSSHIRIRDFHRTGAGGGSSAYVSGTATYACSDILISGFRSRNQIVVEDSDSVVIESTYLANSANGDASGGINITPASATTNLRVIASTIPFVVFNGTSGSTQEVLLDGCTFPAYTAITGVPGETLINGTGYGYTARIEGGNWLNTTGMFYGTQPTTVRISGLKGYNPVGSVTVAVPASGTAVAAAAYDRTFYVTAASGGCTMAIESGPSVVIPASTLGTVHVPAGETVTPTYTTAPTWVVEGE